MSQGQQISVKRKTLAKREFWLLLSPVRAEPWARAGRASRALACRHRALVPPKHFPLGMTAHLTGMRLSQRRERKLKTHTQRLLVPLSLGISGQEILALLAMDCLTVWNHYSKKGNWIGSICTDNCPLNVRIHTRTHTTPQMNR